MSQHICNRYMSKATTIRLFTFLERYMKKGTQVPSEFFWWIKFFPTSWSAVFSQVWRRSIFKSCVSQLAGAIRYLNFKWEFVELFWKNSSYVSGVSVCIFVALYLCIIVCWDVCCKSQEGWRYYELMLRNQWDLGIYLNMALVKVEQGHFETAILIPHNFFVFYYGYSCLETLY